jgi:hypothetical protein
MLSNYLSSIGKGKTRESPLSEAAGQLCDSLKAAGVIVCRLDSDACTECLHPAGTGVENKRISSGRYQHFRAVNARKGIPCIQSDQTLTI